MTATYPLTWSDPAPPTANVSHYDHVVARTPFGELMIEWQSWKAYPGYTCSLYPLNNDFVSGYTLEETKAEVQRLWDGYINSIVNASSEPAPLDFQGS